VYLSRLCDAEVWETRGFDAFRRGEFSAGGANPYVSRSGCVQKVNRWDVNNDGHFDLVLTCINQSKGAWVSLGEQLPWSIRTALPCRCRP